MIAAAKRRAESCRSFDKSFTLMLRSGISSSNQRSVRCTLAMRKSFVDIGVLPPSSLPTGSARHKSKTRYLRARLPWLCQVIDFPR